MAETPTFIDGIGPPLQQIAEDYAAWLPGDASFAMTHLQCAKDVLALVAEVNRLRDALEVIANNTYAHDDRVAWATAVNFGHVRKYARDALDGETT